MLKKLLKYDFKSVFKYWWIAAISSFAVSILGGFCITILESEKKMPDFLPTFAVIGIFITIMGLCAFLITSTILIYARFYKNLFTDEGYLTFTLPVKRSSLLNSKLILNIVTTVVSFFLFGIDILTMLLIGFNKQIFTLEFKQELLDFFAGVKEFFSELSPWFIAASAVEAILIMFLSLVFSAMFMYGCITFASVISKKAKVITVIGIYYVANSVISGLIQSVFLFSSQPLSEWFSKFPEALYEPISALMGLCLVLILALGCALIYWFVYWLLDRKLNLA